MRSFHFLDWIPNPHWYEARDVTAVEWGRGFPETGWVNTEALRLLDSSGCSAPQDQTTLIGTGTLTRKPDISG
jgi:hypothetical protein